MIDHKKIVLSLLVALSLGACQKTTPPKNPPLPVHVLDVVSQEVPIILEATGQTVGSKEVEVRPRISGILQAKGKDYTEGKFVKEGTLLYTLDAQTLAAQLNSAIASENAQKALLQQANDNFTRVQSLYKQNAVSKRDYESAIAARDSAKANYQVQVAQTEAARVNLSYTQIRAPISGFSSSEVQSQGSLVSSQNILTKISQVNPMYVYFSISDNDWLKIRKAQAEGSVTLPDSNQAQVKLILTDGIEHPVVGTMNFMDANVNATTGTIKARATFVNDNNSLMPGMFVRVLLKGATRTNAILIPQRAVVAGVQDQSVWVVNADNKVEKRVIKTAESLDKNIVVVEGLQNGDRVVLDNLSKLAMMPPNSPIEPITMTLEQFYAKDSAVPASAEKP